MATSDDKKAFLKGVAGYDRSPSKSKAIELFDTFLNPHKATASFIYLPHDILQPVANHVQTYRGWLFEREHQFAGGGLKNRFARMRSAGQFKAVSGIFAPAVQLVQRIGFMPAKRHPRLDRQVDPAIVDEAKARLRGKDLLTLLDAGISQRYTDDKARAVDRLDDFLLTISSSLGVGSVRLAELLVEHLQNSRLTINFAANNLFPRPWQMLGEGYKSIWQLPPGVKSDKYLDDRDLVEEELRGFSSPPRTRGRRRAHAFSGSLPTTRPTSPEHTVRGEITRYGRRYAPDSTAQKPVPSGTFNSAMRPQYAAVDFLRAKFGGAVFYGRSFFVVDNRLMHNATITHTDTFDKASKPTGGWQSVLANYHNLYPVVAHTSKDLLAMLISAALGGAKDALHAGGGYSYIECQFQGESYFGREIKEMYVSEAELGLVYDMNDPMLQMAPDVVDELRAETWPTEKLRANIKAFASKHGIALTFIDDRQYPLDISGNEKHLPGYSVTL